MMGPRDVGVVDEAAGTSAVAVRPQSELEEDYESALRIALGLRPTMFGCNEPTVDARPCPHWCLYGNAGDDHEVDPHRPFDAHHSLGVSPVVALSLYAGTWHPSSDGDPSYNSTSSLRVCLCQDGIDQPIIKLNIGHKPGPPDSVKLAVSDARDLVTALTYVIDLAEGRRQVVEGTE